MNILQTQISGLVVVETTRHIDARGSFSRLYCERELSDIVGMRQIVQVNYSRTSAVGAVRGLHFQHEPCAEKKFIRCLKGRVWDVAVDLRANSSTFLKWHAEELSPANARMMVIPEGFAHGFQVLEPESELLYLHTDFYAPKSEDGVRYNDPQLAITWPCPISEISERDSKLQFIDSNFQGFKL